MRIPLSRAFGKEARTTSERQGQGVKQMQTEYVIVEFAGWDNEKIVSEHESWKKACDAFDRYSEDEIEDMDVIIMKRLSDGTLTTEF